MSERVEVTAQRITVYTVGLVYCSVCCEADATDAEIVAHANLMHPTGLSHGWGIAEAPTFATGEPNPSPCNTADGRKHVLLSC